MEFEVQNTGHVDLVADPEGNGWAVFLRVRPIKKGNFWEDPVLGRLNGSNEPGSQTDLPEQVTKRSCDSRLPFAPPG